MIAPILGGFLLDFGSYLPFLLAAAVCVPGAILLLMIREDMNAAKTKENLFAATVSGCKMAAKMPFMRNLIVHQAFLNTAINGGMFLAVMALEEAGYEGVVIGFARAAIGVIGILGALATPMFQRHFNYSQIMVINTICIVLMSAATALLSNWIWLVIPLGLTVVFAPASSAIIFAVMNNIVPEEYFGRVRNLQIQAVLTAARVWLTPLGWIATTFSIALGLWACAGVASLALTHVFHLNAVTRRAEEEKK